MPAYPKKDFQRAANVVKGDTSFVPAWLTPHRTWQGKIAIADQIPRSWLRRWRFALENVANLSIDGISI
jgi:hypothetical protein